MGDLSEPGDFMDVIGDFFSTLMLSVLTLTVSWSKRDSAVSALFDFVDASFIAPDILLCFSFSLRLFFLSFFELLDELSESISPSLSVW